jgi:hypothetical protein
MSDSHQTPNKEDSKSAAQPENEDSSPSPEPNRRRLNKQEHEADNMKKRLANFDENTQKQLREQGEKHAMEIAAMKRANLDTQTFNNKDNTCPYNERSQNNCSSQSDDQTFRNSLRWNT